MYFFNELKKKINNLYIWLGSLVLKSPIIEDRDERISWERESWEEFLRFDPVATSFVYVSFVSKSKGHGKKRKPREVVLVGYRGRFWTWDRFPFDVYAGEVLHGRDDREVLGAEDYLRRMIPMLCRRRVG